MTTRPEYLSIPELLRIGARATYHRVRDGGLRAGGRWKADRDGGDLQVAEAAM